MSKASVVSCFVGLAGLVIVSIDPRPPLVAFGAGAYAFSLIHAVCQSIREAARGS